MLANVVRVGAVLAAALALPLPSAAATFVVDSTGTGADIAPGDGLCATAAGTCTLQAAIQESNGLPGPDEILLGAGTHEATDDTLLGPVWVHGTGSSTTVVMKTGGNVLSLEGAAGIVVEDLTLVGYAGGFGGYPVALSTTGDGVIVRRCILRSDGLGLRTSGHTQLETCSITQCHVAIACSGGSLSAWGTGVSGNATDATHQGGAIGSLNAGSVRLVSCAITGNGNAFAGGLVVSGAMLEMIDTEVSSNYAVDGAALNIYGGTVHVSCCRFGSNAYNAIRVLGGSLRMENTLLDRNRGSSFDPGGSLVLLRGRATVVNCTIDGGASGDGVRVAAGATGTLLSTTITGCAGAGIAVEPGGVARVGRVLAASNVAGDLSGTIESLGWNLFRDPGTAVLTGVLAGNIVGADPRLGPLADHGGPTATRAPAAGSPAIDAVDPVACIDDADVAVAWDQRGAARPADGDSDGEARCDVGAYEALAPPAVDGDADGVPDACDDCPLDPDPEQRDSDGDLVADACDCAPDDGAAWSSPSESLVLVARSPVTGEAILSWDGSSTTTHDVARELLSILRSLRVADAPCVALGVTGATFTDGAAAPPDDGLYWLVRPSNACGVGSWGADSFGSPRPACP